MRVCILGVGLSSLTLAKALVNLNIHVDLISQKKKLKINENRTIGISENNVEYFNNHIINIEKIIWKLKKIEILSENLNDEKLLIFEDNKKNIITIIKNYELSKRLENNLKRNKYFRKISFKQKKSYFDNFDIVINTDYFSSFTKKYFYKQIEKKYNSFAYTTIIEHQKILNDTAIQIFTKKGPLAFLPISSENTSIVYSVHNSKKTNLQNIKELIKSYNFKYKIKKVNVIESFELKSYILRSYYNNKFLAFGDLLHRIHPLAGQGFNMTLRDIQIFVKIIENKKKLGLPLDSSINSEFESKTKHKNFIFANGVDLIHEFFNLERKIKSSTLSKSIQFLGKIPRLNKVFTKVADKGI